MSRRSTNAASDCRTRSIASAPKRARQQPPRSRFGNAWPHVSGGAPGHRGAHDQVESRRLRPAVSAVPAPRRRIPSAPCPPATGCAEPFVTLASAARSRTVTPPSSTNRMKFDHITRDTRKRGRLPAAIMRCSNSLSSSIVNATRRLGKEGRQRRRLLHPHDHATSRDRRNGVTVRVHARANRSRRPAWSVPDTPGSPPRAGLTQRGKTVAVVEARDRVGGRIWTEQLSDGNADRTRGGAWLAPKHDAMFGLTRELNVSTYKTWVKGAHLLIDGEPHPPLHRAHPQDQPGGNRHDTRWHSGRSTAWQAGSRGDAMDREARVRVGMHIPSGGSSSARGSAARSAASCSRWRVQGLFTG